MAPPVSIAACITGLDGCAKLIKLVNDGSDVFHPCSGADPIDRQIIAQALAEDIPVVTSDRSFSLYKGLRVVW